jgi:type I restriction enzyme, S subunit
LVLLGEDGAPFLQGDRPKAYIVRGKSWVNNHAHVLRALGDTPSLFWKYQLDQVQYRPFVSGTTRLKLSQTPMRRIPLVLPPLAEQQRIVEAIESYFTRLDDAVATLERVQRNLKRYRASVLKAAVEGRLVPTEAELARAEGRDYEPASVLLERLLAERRRRWHESGARGKYQEPAAPATTNLPTLPEGWCWASLPQLGELNRGRSKHRPRNDPRLLGGPYPFIQTADVRNADCFITSHEARYSELGLAQSRLWPAGTLCITIAANIAETGILRFDACFPDSVVGFLQEEPLITRYVELFIRTVREKLTEYAPATAQKNINLQTLSEISLPLPPAAEQGRIVAEVDRQLSVARHCEEVAWRAEGRCARLRQAILKWAFEGKLADQDSSDEPAALLIERIRSQTLVSRPPARDTGAGRRRQGGRHSRSGPKTKHES